MYPPSPYAVPVGSFQTPVALPTTDPLEGPFFYVGINCDWMPLIVGALKQLLLQSTWATNDINALQKVQGQVFNLIAQFNCATAPTLEQLCGLIGSGCEEDCMCCLRVQNGVLQQLVCGTYIDVPGQPIGGFQSSSQPGSGSPQPPPNGGCQQYHASFPGNGLWLLPTVVSTGDTLLVSGQMGVSYDGDFLLWYCPDGSQFFAGVCTGLTTLQGGDPLPTVPHMKLVAKIGSTFYDVEPGTFTIPAGHASDPVTFQVNDDSLDDDAGSLSFDVQVCNNQAGTWVHTFDFSVDTQGWAPYDTGAGNFFGTWSAGLGWANTDASNSGLNARGVAITRTFTTTELTSVQMTFDYALGTVDSGVFTLQNVADAVTNFIVTHLSDVVTGTNAVQFGAADSPGQTHINLQYLCDITAGARSGSVLLKKIVLTGKGANPFI